MADRDDIDRKDDEHGIVPPEASPAAKSGLPHVESPSISPAIEEQAAEPKHEPEVVGGTKLRALVPLPATKFADEEPFEPLAIEDEPPRFAVKPRYKRMLRLAAAVAIGAGFGAVAGTLMTGGFAGAPKVDVAARQEKQAMQQSVAALTREVTTLKASLDAASKRAQMQTASLEKKLSEQINERLKKEMADITGSITPPQTVAAAAAPLPVPTPAAPAVTFADVPTPRPAPRVAMASGPMPQSQPSHPPVIRDWSVRGAHNGYVYVQGQRGDIYQIVPGAPLPGLGPVESVRRMDGRWVVKTPKGIIVSMQDRRYFE